jgi:serine/threonine protein phosphatase PrpC
MYIPTEQRITTRPYRSISPYAVETLLEKGSSELNEDVLLQDGNLFGVFDGATSLGKSCLPAGLTGGLLAAQIAADAFQHGGHDLYRAAENANCLINDAIRRNNISQDGRHLLWSTSAAVIRVDTNHFDYCQTGDSLILLIHEDGGYRQLTPETDHDRETLDLWKKSDPSSGAAIHDVLSDQIREVRLQMNISYGVLNGEPEAMHFINHGREELDGVSAILIFTDGLFIPREHLQQQSDWDSFVGLYRQGGLRKIRDHVRSLQRQDPICRRYPRFKPHDDIAAVAVTWND